MDLKLAGKKAVVTGGSKGIGRETARILAEEGCDVAITAREEGRLKEVADTLASATGQTVLPLVNRTAKALSAWLGPAFGERLELRPDLDQIEALGAEREALWARLERASFLTRGEKRAAVGYGPVEEDDS